MEGGWPGAGEEQADILHGWGVEGHGLQNGLEGRVARTAWTPGNVCGREGGSLVRWPQVGWRDMVPAGAPGHAPQHHTPQSASSCSVPRALDNNDEPRPTEATYVISSRDPNQTCIHFR